MKINSINEYNFTFYSRIKSNNLKFKNDDFFIKIRGFGRNIDWVNQIKLTADNASEEIKSSTDLIKVLKDIATGVRSANQYTLSLLKRHHTGIMRNIHSGSAWNNLPLTTSYTISRYKGYEQKLDHTIKHPLKNPYSDISLTVPFINADNEKFLMHGQIQKVQSAIKIVSDIYNSIIKDYISHGIKHKSIPHINSLIAEIRWILAHATPWERGSDAISNVFMRALYKACGIKSYPLKQGISLDLEAYCTELKEYKKHFSNYFEKKPHYVKDKNNGTP